MSEDSPSEHPNPNFSSGLVTDLLARDFGVSGTLTPLVSYGDQNFRVDTASGQYVLKISNAAEDPGGIDAQNEAMIHLESIDPRLGVPRVVRTKEGSPTTIWESGAENHIVRMLSYLPGTPLATVKKTPALLASAGTLLGRTSRALAGFGHPATNKPQYSWNLDNALSTESLINGLEDPKHREMVSRVFDRYRTTVLPRVGKLRASVLHQDANDYNLIVDKSGDRVSGLIDFGDLLFGHTINELAISLSYLLAEVDDLYAGARAMISSYAAEFPVQEAEADVLFDLAATRIAMGVCLTTESSKRFPDNEYLLISQAAGFRLLDRLDRTNPALLSVFARDAAGLSAVGHSTEVVNWMRSGDCNPAPLFDFDLNTSGRHLVSLKEGAPGMEHSTDPEAHWSWLSAAMRESGAQFAIGTYGELRDVYAGEQFASAASPERRSQHLGLDLYVEPLTPLHAPLDGQVLSVVDNDLAYDYGPTVIIEHQAGTGGASFFTLYGHLSRESLAMVRPGMTVSAGDTIGTIGDWTVNGGWSPHLHFQIITDRLELEGTFPGVGEPSLWSVWSSISPDPNLLLRLAPESFETDSSDIQTLLTKRDRVLGPSLSTSYRKKLHIVRGEGVHLYDHTGRAFLDCVNNICHVGHCHPRVVEALTTQASTLNTNTRYLHRKLLDYAERLSATLPDPLSVVYLVCSGSEANELALRIARTVTGRRDVVTVDWGYHGNTGAAIEVSPYKFNRAGGSGRPTHVQVAELPDPYRGPYQGYGVESAEAYATSVEHCVETIRATTGEGPAAFIVEAISGCGGQVVYPAGYLKAAAGHVSAAGGLTIVDEVQTGFGRVGKQFWAHQSQGVVPDIVTMGKPIGNGHPMAAVVTTRDIADQFDNGMEFFSSFGGNPVSAAVGMAVLDVIEEEGLQQNALETGTYLRLALDSLATDHELIGDVRGEGLFLGVDLVKDRETKTAATGAASDLVNLTRDAGILLSTDGPGDNVIKIKPPMVFSRTDSDQLLDALDQGLASIRKTGQ